MRDTWNRILWRWLPFIGWMALIYWLSDQPQLPHPARRLGLSDYLFDYGAHAGAFGLLALLAWRAFSPAAPEHENATSARSRGRWTLWSAGLWALIYALLDEAHQRFVPGRWSSWRDWLADLAGILIAMILLVTWIRYESAIKGWWHAMRAHRSSRRGSRGRWAREGESSGSPNDQG